MALTTKIGLTKPAYNDARWDIPLNADLDIIDALAGMTPSTVKALTGVAASVDVFVYNTSKDSDGGAWRKRCQEKSWYNETLNTATRGATREFPAVALIVAETTKVTIFDATVAGCPMWMVFYANQSGYSIYASAGFPLSSVSIINGLLCCTASGTTGGLSVVSFMKDTTEIRISNTTRYYVRAVVDRNTVVINSFSAYYSDGIVNAGCNDIAMTVIPGAPIDALTGLPVPTIAVATAGGVSIIDGYAGVGTVVDDVFNTSYIIYKVDIANGRIFMTTTNSLMSAPLSAFLADGSYVGSTVNWQTARSGKFYSNTGNGTTYTIPATVAMGLLESKCSIANKASGSLLGLTLLSEDTTTYTNGMVAHITKDYNTGWMKGDIRRAIACEALGTTAAVGATVADRSVKATTLTKTGTLSYSPVATGAELQAISGFSTSNYLSQAYSADLDFGTGDFYIAGWINEPPNTIQEYILSRAYYPGAFSGPGLFMNIAPTGLLSFRISDDAFATSDIITSTLVIDDSIPKFFIAQRVGTKLELWLNSKKDATDVTISSALLSLNNANATLNVGVTQSLVGGVTGKLSLLRMGAGNLSATQIAKMYNDELPMFQAGAKCRIQGTSSQVNALAYNDKLSTLLVATPNALTEFNGLTSRLSDRVTASTAINAVSTDSDVVVSSLPATVYASIQGMNLVERIEASENKPQSKTFGDVVGGNYSEFEYDGTLKFNGAATVWEDENLDPLSLSGGGTAPTAISFSTTAIQIASFVNAATDQVAGTKELPHKWKLGSAIYFHCHWYPTTTNTGVCRFGLEYFFSVEGVVPTFPAIIYIEQAAGGTVWARKTSTFAAITPPSELGTQLHFRFFRDGSHANDTFTGNAAVGTVGFHYESDAGGSRLVGTK